MSWVGRLDARRRAMLAEIGVRVWAPVEAEDARAEANAPVAQAPAPGGAAPAAPAAPGGPAVPASGTGGVAHAPAPADPHADTRAGRIAVLDWDALRASVAACEACALCQTRRNTVFGVGDPRADWMVIGEAPGEQEDRLGEPFVGPAGQLLDRMLHAVGRRRDGQQAQGVYIANVLKCRPPANRNPHPEEVVRCEPYLMRQVALVQPRIILAMGRFAVQSILRTDEPIGRLRGRVHRYQGVPVVVTYHPAYLLRNPADKAKAWADLCLALDTAGAAPEGGDPT
jgi:uracil-DNA glycosylase family 4